MYRDQLRIKNRNIYNVGEIDMQNDRPTFGGNYNLFRGLMILINDTEYSEIQLDRFYISPTGLWNADVTVTIMDHFGLDRHDARKYQYDHTGFADWWLLQHDRGYVPYQTKVTVRMNISQQL